MEVSQAEFTDRDGKEFWVTWGKYKEKRYHKLVGIPFKSSDYYRDEARCLGYRGFLRDLSNLPEEE
jgi:hypothetical protein